MEQQFEENKAHGTNETFLLWSNWIWLWREKSKSLAADKRDVRDCTGWEKVWYVSGIKNWLEWEPHIRWLRDSGLTGWTHHRPQTTDHRRLGRPWRPACYSDTFQCVLSMAIKRSVWERTHSFNQVTTLEDLEPLFVVVILGMVWFFSLYIISHVGTHTTLSNKQWLP